MKENHQDRQMGLEGQGLAQGVFNLNSNPQLSFEKIGWLLIGSAADGMIYVYIYICELASDWLKSSMLVTLNDPMNYTVWLIAHWNVTWHNYLSVVNQWTTATWKGPCVVLVSQIAVLHLTGKGCLCWDRALDISRHVTGLRAKCTQNFVAHNVGKRSVYERKRAGSVATAQMKPLDSSCRRKPPHKRVNIRI